MPAYAIFDNLEVLDPESLAQYKDAVAAVVDRHGGRYLAVGGRVDRMEGSWSPNFPVIIEFPSLEDAHRWYDSDDYHDLKALRLSAVRSNAVFVEGLRDYRARTDDESFRGS